MKQQQSVTLRGQKLTGDPGTSRYAAPYYLPESLQALVPRVLLSDPWPDARDARKVRAHAQLVLLLLHARAPEVLSARAIFDDLNALAEEGRLADLPRSPACELSPADAANQAGALKPGSPLFGSQAYVKELLEHLRRSRLVYGKRNPGEHKLTPAHPDHPRLYGALPYQQLKKGSAAVLAVAEQKERVERVSQALRRLRRGTTPYPSFRGVAQTSALQVELARLAREEYLRRSQGAWLARRGREEEEERERVRQEEKGRLHRLLPFTWGKQKARA